MNPPIDPRHLIAERRRRQEHFPDMTEPGWFMLLKMVVSAEEGRQLTILQAAACAFVPPTSALRHLGWLVEDGMVERSVDPKDARRIFVALTATGARRMATYLKGKRKYRVR